MTTLLTSGSVLAAFFAGGVALFAPWLHLGLVSGIVGGNDLHPTVAGLGEPIGGGIEVNGMISAPRSATAAWRSGVVSPQAATISVTPARSTAARAGDRVSGGIGCLGQPVEPGGDP